MLVVCVVCCAPPLSLGELDRPAGARAGREQADVPALGRGRRGGRPPGSLTVATSAGSAAGVRAHQAQEEEP